MYAVALNDAGRNGKALEVLENDVARHPYNCDALAALVSFHRNAGNPVKAADYAKRLAELGHAYADPRSAQQYDETPQPGSLSMRMEAIRPWSDSTYNELKFLLEISER